MYKLHEFRQHSIHAAGRFGSLPMKTLDVDVCTGILIVLYNLVGWLGIWIMFLLLFLEMPVCLCSQRMQSVESGLELLIQHLTVSPEFHMFTLRTCIMCNHQGWSSVDFSVFLQQLNCFHHAQSNFMFFSKEMLGQNLESELRNACRLASGSSKMGLL